MDILHSLSWVAAGLPAPKDTTSSVVRNAIGNVTTCNIQGFMSYTGLVGSVSYDCMLSIYFVMVVVYSKREDEISKRIEPFFHILSICAPLGAGIFLMVTENFNNAGAICWIHTFPVDCAMDADIVCTRGENAFTWLVFFLGFPLALCFLIIIGCMLRLSYSVWKQLKKMRKYGASEFAAKVKRKRRQDMTVTSPTEFNQKLKRRIATSARKSHNETRQTFTQAMLYVVALCLTFFFAITIQIMGPEYFWLYVLQGTFVPLLGFFNFFIFIRPRVVMTMQTKPELSFFRACFAAIKAKEVQSPTGRRCSLGINTRRSSQTFSGFDTVAAAVRAMQAEDSREEGKEAIESSIENEHRFEGELDEIKGDLFSYDTNELDEMGIDSLSEVVETEDTSDTNNDAEDEEFKMTEDYRNML